MDMFDQRRHPSVVDRYYSRKYKTDIQGNLSEDQCILLHSNKVCVVTVAQSHPILSEGKTIAIVNFQVDKGINRLDNKVSGKGKRGAQWLKPNSPLCSLTCEDGSSYTLVSCVRGMLLEVNENLVHSPHLVTNKPETEGYLAIVLPVLKDYQSVISKLDSQEKYTETLRMRALASRQPEESQELS